MHVPFTYYPDAVGGTEVYVHSLARGLMALGIDSLVAAPGSTEGHMVVDGVNVVRFVLPPARGPDDVYAADDRLIPTFDRLLHRHCPDVVHMHAATSQLSVHLVRRAREQGIPTLFTYHLSAMTCQRGSLRLYGRGPCDGRMIGRRCAACAMQGRGLPRPLASVIAASPNALGDATKRIGLSGGIFTAIRMRSLVTGRHASTMALLQEVDRIVTLAHWSQEILEVNGVARNRITLSRHGIEASTGPCPPAMVDIDSRPLKVAYLGRLAPEKGVDLLLKAMAEIRTSNVTLDIFGTTQDSSMADELRRLGASLPLADSVRFLDPIAHQDVTSVLRGYHVLAVPSQWLETGPLVVLEAFAAGTPVIASNFGSLVETIENGVTGTIVEENTPVAWARRLEQLATDHSLLKGMRAKIPEVRPIEIVAAEMAALYEAVTCQEAA